MNLLKKLTIKSLMLNKKRTIVTIIGIILSVALITAVASMYFSAINSLISFEVMKKGDYHIDFKNVDIADIKDFEKNKNIEKIYITQDDGYSILEGCQNKYKPYVFIKKFTKDSIENLGIKVVEGRLPQNENEIIIPTHLKTNGRVKLNVGEEIILNVGKRVDSNGNLLTQQDEYSLNDEISVEYSNNIKSSNEKIIDAITKKYKIVGICERPSYEIENYSAPGYTFITILNPEKINGKVDVFVRYSKFGLNEEPKVTSSILGIDEKVYKNLMYGYDKDKVVTNDKLEKDMEEFDKAKYKIETNGYLIRLESKPFSEDGGLVGIAGICCGIIIVSSVFCIKNSFDISITEKIKQYGMLISVGATKKQVKKTVYFEACVLGVIGIPLGILAGFLASYILVIISNKLLINSLIEGFKLIFTFSWEATVIAVILGILTIWLSSIRSARKASKISPILAIRNSGDIKIKSKKIKSPKIISKIFGIGGEISYKNLKRNKKKYRTTSVSIIVVVSVFIPIYYFSGLVFDSVKSEFNMQEYNLSLSIFDYDKEDVNEILNLDNIEQASVLREKSINIKNVKFSEKYKNILKSYNDDENSMQSYYDNKKEECMIFSVGNESYKNYIKKLGLNYNDVKDKCILYNFKNIAIASNQIQKVPMYDYKIGDNIKFSLNDSNEEEYNIKIAKVTSEYPFGLYNGVQCIIVSDEYFDNLELNSPTKMVDICINSSNADKLQDDIEKALGEDKKYSINNIAENQRMMQNIFLLIAIFIYGFIIVISLIGVTNIFNTITTSMELRRREFASLRSIGMTDKEFKRMIRLESAFLGCKSLFFGLPIGIGLSYLINYYFVQNLGEKIIYKLPIMAIIIASFVVFILIAVIMKYALEKIKKQNIIETIRNENI